MTAYLTGYQGFTDSARSATIAQGDSLSGAISTGGFTLVGILVPALFTGTGLSYFAANSVDGFQAKGELIFTGTASPGDQVQINGSSVTFVASSPGALEVLIGGSAEDTATNLQAFLSTSQDAALLQCSYAVEGNVVTVTAKTAGEVGNNLGFTKSSSDITINAATGYLSGGGYLPICDLTTGVPITNQVVQGNFYAVGMSNLFKGLNYFKIQSNATENADRTILCALKG